MLKDKLEAVASQIESIVADGKVTIIEVVDTIKVLATAVKEEIAEFPSPPAESQVESLLKESWEWADTRWSLVERADAALKLPIIAEPFDGPAIRLIVKIGLEAIAKKIV